MSNKFFYIDFKLRRFYALTVIAVIYAGYNTFNSFSVLSVIGYLICIAFILILYRPTVQYCITYLRNIIEKDRTKL